MWAGAVRPCRCCYYEGGRKQFAVYGYEPDNGQPHRRIIHCVSWTTVAGWLATWTTIDRDTLVRLDRQRFDLEHTPEELVYNPAWTIADSRAIAARRDARMEAGDRDKIRDLTERIRAP